MRRRETGYSSNPSNSGVGNGLGSFGPQRSIFPNLFGGRDPFDDPFFTQPFGSLFGSNMFCNNDPHSLQTPFGSFFGPNMFSSNNPHSLQQEPFGSLFGSNMLSNNDPRDLHQQASRSSEPVIKLLDSDDERDSEEKEEDDIPNSSWENKNPLVEHPEDQESGCVEEKGNNKQLAHRTDQMYAARAQPQMRSVSFKRVSCGGVDGTYYSATTTRAQGSDGVMLEESKQADKRTGEATHRVSRGINDKGHSIMKKLDSDGKVEKMQMLHNLHGDELAGFEKSWKASADTLIRMNNGNGFPGNLGASSSGHSQMANWGGFGNPFGEYFSGNGNRFQGIEDNLQNQSSDGRPKKTFRIDID